ncbi:MAG TPA: glycosyl transferase [Solibacterales bacterium]|nr:glycosyl transferase [Bryobacterales bacterium]
MISVIIPALNEEREIARTIVCALAMEEVGEVIVVDGGSQDGTVGIARAMGAAVVECERGRGRQMHAGALAASGEVLWFVHADTRPESGATRQIVAALGDALVVGGNCTLAFDGETRGARLLNAVQPLMKRLGVYYGDSTIFVRRSVYCAAGGCRPYPLFEDSDLIQRVRALGRFVSLDARVVTSSRRFEQRGFLRTCFLWTSLQMLFWCGVPAERLGKWYAPVRRDTV